MQTSQFFRMRVSAGITSAELADFAGCARSLMFQVETGREPVQAWMVSALQQMIRERAA